MTDSVGASLPGAALERFAELIRERRDKLGFSDSRDAAAWFAERGVGAALEAGPRLCVYCGSPYHGANPREYCVKLASTRNHNFVPPATSAADGSICAACGKQHLFPDQWGGEAGPSPADLERATREGVNAARDAWADGMDFDDAVDMGIGVAFGLAGVRGESVPPLPAGLTPIQELAQAAQNYLNAEAHVGVTHETLRELNHRLGSLAGPHLIAYEAIAPRNSGNAGDFGVQGPPQEKPSA